MGGNSSSAGPFYSSIDRILFPFDSGTGSNVGSLTIEKRQAGACNSTNYGYYSGGGTNVVIYSSIDRIVFPFDSGTSSHVGDLSQTKHTCAGVDGTDFTWLFN
jgi:hypothetical protein